MATLLSKIKKDFPELQLEAGRHSSWSAGDNKITFEDASSGQEQGEWMLLHEVAHAKLGHTSFASDFELLKLEVEAWAEAAQLATKYGFVISENFVEDCLDTYRDWLYQRSTCPNCSTASLQIDKKNLYLCHNCNHSWRVSSARFCRPYRRSTTGAAKII